MKPTPEQLTAAVYEMASVIPYFPRDSGGQALVMRELAKFVTNGYELRWLVDTAAGAMRGWKGLPELRGLYCTRFKPADGREEDCRLPGFTPEESETHSLLEETKRKALPESATIKKLAEAKRL